MYEIRGENMNSEIQIRFIEGTAIDSRIIRWQTRAWCSHVEAILPGEKTLGALFNGGVAIRNFSDKCYRDVKRWEDWHIPCEQYQATIFIRSFTIKSVSLTIGERLSVSRLANEIGRQKVLGSAQNLC